MSILVERLRSADNWWLERHGELPKRPKGSDCKSDCSAFGGSNPSLATIVMFRDMCLVFESPWPSAGGFLSVAPGFGPALHDRERSRHVDHASVRAEIPAALESAKPTAVSNVGLCLVMSGGLVGVSGVVWGVGGCVWLGGLCGEYVMCQLAWLCVRTVVFVCVGRGVVLVLTILGGDVHGDH